MAPARCPPPALGLEGRGPPGTHALRVMCRWHAMCPACIARPRRDLVGCWVESALLGRASRASASPPSPTLHSRPVPSHPTARLPLPSRSDAAGARPPPQHLSRRLQQSPPAHATAPPACMATHDRGWHARRRRRLARVADVAQPRRGSGQSRDMWPFWPQL